MALKNSRETGISDLFEAVLSGEASAEEKLFEVLSERFLALTRKRIWNENKARDVVQETLLAIAANYKTAEFKAGFTAWAHRVLKNRILAHLKSERSRTEKMSSFTDSHHISSALEDPDLRRRLIDCLKKIHKRNPRLARTINLQYQGYSVAEICSRMAINTNSLYIMLHRTRVMLKLCLKKGEID